MSDEARNDTSFSRRVLALAARVVRGRNKPADPRRERLLLVASVVVFIGASVLAWRNLPESPEGARLWPLVVVALVGVPLTVAVNAVEFHVTASLVQRRFAWLESFRIAVLSSAANLLPIPGAVMVRARALSQVGVRVGRAVSAPALMGLGWISTGAALASIPFLVQVGPVAGLVSGAAGIIGLGVLGATLRSIDRASAGRRLVEIVLVESGSVVVQALRYGLVLYAFGYDVQLVEPLALTLAGVLASATGFFPGGLGIRELFAALISPLVGLDPAVGLLVTAVDRLIGLVVLALLAGGMVLTGRVEVAAAGLEMPEAPDVDPPIAPGDAD